MSCRTDEQLNQKRFIMKFPNRHLVLLTSVLIALISASSYDRSVSAALSTAQRPRSVATTQEPTSVVVVKSLKANVRETPSRLGRVVTEVHKDKRAPKPRAAPSEPGYGVGEEQTGAEGWIHGSTIAFESAPVATSTETPRRSETARPRGVTPPISGR